MRRWAVLVLVVAVVGVPEWAPRAAVLGAAERRLDYVQPVRGPIVRHFEPPPTPYAAGHRGVDFGAPAGSTVTASASGTVAFAGSVGGALYVSIDHADGLRTTYSYLSAILVRSGSPVAQGEAIARSGAGHPGATEPHLHFGVRRGDEYLDPEEILAESLRRNVWRAVALAPDAG